MTGVQALMFWGRSRSQLKAAKEAIILGNSPADPVYKTVLDSVFEGLAVCVHAPVQRGDPRGGCLKCGVYNVFSVFASKIVPVLQAIDDAELQAACGQGGFVLATFKETLRSWGDSLVTLFHGRGTKKVISAYRKLSRRAVLCGLTLDSSSCFCYIAVHLIIEHLAELLAERGPLAYWSQQAIEAAHKILKEAWSHSTAHDGGKGSAGRSIEQVMFPLLPLFV